MQPFFSSFQLLLSNGFFPFFLLLVLLRSLPHGSMVGNGPVFVHSFYSLHELCNLEKKFSKWWGISQLDLFKKKKKLAGKHEYVLRFQYVRNKDDRSFINFSCHLFPHTCTWTTSCLQELHALLYTNTQMFGVHLSKSLETAQSIVISDSTFIYELRATRSSWYSGKVYGVWAKGYMLILWRWFIYTHSLCAYMHTHIWT